MDRGIVGVLICELVFGVVFNLFTALSEREGWIDGFVSLYVVVGVAITVIVAAPIISWKNVGYLAIFFSGSGVPMITGSIIRYVQAREAENKRIAIMTKGGHDGHT